MFKNKKNIASLLCLLIFAFGFFINHVLADAAYDEAYEKTKAEFSSIKASVEKTSEYVKQAADAATEAEKYFYSNKKNLSKLSGFNKSEANQIILKIGETRKKLTSYNSYLTSFTDKAGKVTSAFDAYDDMVKLKAKTDSYKDTMGELSGYLFKLSNTMEKYGDKVPLIGSIISGYGQVTSGMIDKISQVSNTIDENRNQGAISGPGFYKAGKALHKYNVLLAQSEYLAKNVRYEPSRPSYIFRSTVSENSRNHPALLWDDEAQTFYLVSSSVPLEEAFQRFLTIKRRFTPYELNEVAKKWDTVYEPRKEKVPDLHRALASLRGIKTLSAFSKADSTGSLTKAYNMEQYEFESRYMFDNDFRVALHSGFNRICANLVKNKQYDDAKKLKAFCMARGINITVIVPEPPKPAAKPAAKTATKPQTAQNVKKTAVVQNQYKPNNNVASKPQYPQNTGSSFFDSLMNTLNTVSQQLDTISKSLPESTVPVNNTPAQNTQQNVQTATVQNTVVQPVAAVQPVAVVQPVQQAAPQVIDYSGVCAVYMQIQLNEVATMNNAEHNYRMVFTSGYSYKNGSCFGSSKLYQTYKDYYDGSIKESEVNTFYTPENPYEISVSTIIEKYSSKYPDLFKAYK